ncbi:MAG: GntR family transcriptional regulator [Tepidiforma sp.]
MDIVIDMPELRGQPAYVRLAEGLRRAILEGRFQPGERLPATRALARTLGIARNTVLEAYDQLTAEGYLAARRGSGTFVAPELPERAFRARRPATPALTPGARPASSPAECSAFARRLPAEDPVPAMPHGRLPFDFRYGTPSLAEFPLAEWRSLTRRVLDYPPSRAAGLRTG